MEFAGKSCRKDSEHFAGDTSLPKAFDGPPSMGKTFRTPLLSAIHVRGCVLSFTRQMQWFGGTPDAFSDSCCTSPDTEARHLNSENKGQFRFSLLSPAMFYSSTGGLAQGERMEEAYSRVYSSVGCAAHGAVCFILSNRCPRLTHFQSPR